MKKVNNSRRRDLLEVKCGGTTAVRSSWVMSASLALDRDIWRVLAHLIHWHSIVQFVFYHFISIAKTDYLIESNRLLSNADQRGLFLLGPVDMRRDLLEAFAAKLSARDIVVIKATGNASSAVVRTVEQGSFGPVFLSSTDTRLRHFATVFGLIPSSRLSTASEAPIAALPDGVCSRGAAVTNPAHSASFRPTKGSHHQTRRSNT
jgi:hypothetical protein